MKPRQYYKEKLAEAEDKLAILNMRLKWLSLIRLLLFMAAITSVFYFIPKSLSFGALISIFVSTLFGFSVKIYFRYSKTKKLLNNHIQIFQEELKALKWDYEAFDEGTEFINPEHYYSYDLDFFGKGSIYQYLNRTKTYFGKELLADKLQQPFLNEKDIAEHQEAIKEISVKTILCHKFRAIAMELKNEKEDIEKLQKWLGEDPLFYPKAWVKIVRILVPIIICSAFTLTLLGKFSEQYLMLLLTLPFSLIGFNIRKVNSLQTKIGKTKSILYKYVDLLKLLEKEEFTSSLINRRLANIRTGERASQLIRQFARHVNAFDNRLNLIVGVLGNMLFLSDINIVWGMEKFKEKVKPDMMNWVQSLAYADFLMSLGTYAFNNPDYIYPLVDKNTIIESKNLGHVLLTNESRVPNDFGLKSIATYSIITGPNMAGKSTMLRTIGTSLVLAMLGAPLCCSEFRFKPIKLFSSMRTSDSLYKHESYFYAELKRLKFLVEYLQGDHEVFVILDEILKGTNSKDKQEGSKVFMKKLVEFKSSGVVATHDLNLGDLEKESPEHFKNQSFEVEMDGDELVFDFKLRDGITTKMNASYLMKSMNII